MFAKSNYPPGTSDSDPFAPWNEQSYDSRECTKCGSIDTFIAKTTYTENDILKSGVMRVCRYCWNKFN